MDSKKFKEWRNKRGITQERAAEILGVSRVTIARYETSGNIPRSIEILCAMLDGLRNSSLNNSKD